jgi:outer membrane protein OmpA-like peptidoglycan-associated protein/tetratricopeptide (TPR) repeat protein
MKQTLTNLYLIEKQNGKNWGNLSNKKIKTLFLYILLILLSITQLSAQGILKKADQHYNSLEYSKALVLYKKAYSKSPSYKAAQMAANCYRHNNNSLEAENWYLRALLYTGYEPIIYKNLADAMKMNGKYEAAQEYYLKYAEAAPEDSSKALFLAESCTMALNWLSGPLQINVVKDEKLNSSNSDFCPVFYKNGVVITSDRFTERKTDINGWTGTPYFSLFYAENKDGQWQEAIELDEKNINTDYHNGPAAFSPTGDTIYFTRVNRLKKRIKIKANNPMNWFNFRGSKYINHNELYYSVKTPNGWSTPVSFPFNNPLKYSVGHPAASPDGNILYFASDMPGGFGGSDLYFCERIDSGGWSDPVNLGERINTSENESFPTVRKDGTLFFSSDGLQGFGGLDIFAALGSKNEWEEPENLKSPYNSPQDDFGILFYDDLTSGFISSGRDSENGKDNIFKFDFQKPPQQFILAGLVINPDNQPLSGAIIDIQESLSNKKIIDDVFTDAAGKFFIPIEKNDYLAVASKNHYKENTFFLESEMFSQDTIYITLMLEPQQVYTANTSEIKEFQANNIYFDLNKHFIREDASIELDKIAVVMLDNDDIRVELSAHCDCRAGDEYNMLLSQRRAKSTVDYLVKKGIDKGNITAIAYGKTKLINKCIIGIECSEEEHQENRRVEIKLIFQQEIPAKYTER